MHQLGLRLAQTPARGMLKWMDSRLGYGKTFDKDAMSDWWLDRPQLQETGVNTAGSSKEKNLPNLITITETTTPQDVFEALIERLNQHPEKISGLNVIFQFSLSGDHGGEYYVRVRDNHAEAGQGKRPDASCTYVMQDSDFLLLIAGKLSAPKGLVTGKIHVRGEMSLAMKLRTLIS